MLTDKTTVQAKDPLKNPAAVTNVLNDLYHGTNKQPLPQPETHEEHLARQEAEKAWKAGEFPCLLKKAYEKIWCGDEELLEWVACAFANGFIKNADEALHMAVLGQSGLGKTEATRQAFKLLHPDYVIDGQFTQKGFMYLAFELKRGTIILCDEGSLSPEQAAIYRNLIASWHKPCPYYSVDKQKSVPHIPQARLTQVFTRAEGISDVDSEGQNESRFANMELSRTDDDIETIWEFIQDETPREVPETELNHIREIWKIIISGEHTVELPFKKDIKIHQSAKKRFRDFKRFCSLIRSIALINGRTTATDEDYKRACELWKHLLLMIDNTIPGLMESEQRVYDTIQKLIKGTPIQTASGIVYAGGGVVLLSSLKAALPDMNQSIIYRTIYGRGGNFTTITGGLLTKVRGLSIESICDSNGRADKEIRLSSEMQKGAAPYTYLPEGE